MDRIIEFFLAMAVIGATLAFGGVHSLAHSPVGVGLFPALLMLLLKPIREGKIGLAMPLWPGLFGVLVVLHVIPLPAQLIKGYSPAGFQDLGLGALVTNRGREP